MIALLPGCRCRGFFWSFLVTEGQAFQPVIDDIVLAANSSIEGEWENRVVYLPFS